MMDPMCNPNLKEIVLDKYDMAHHIGAKMRVTTRGTTTSATVRMNVRMRISARMRTRMSAGMSVSVRTREMWVDHAVRVASKGQSSHRVLLVLLA